METLDLNRDEHGVYDVYTNTLVVRFYLGIDSYEGAEIIVSNGVVLVKPEPVLSLSKESTVVRVDSSMTLQVELGVFQTTPVTNIQKLC